MDVVFIAVITPCHDCCGWFFKPQRDWGERINISSNLVCGKKQGLPSLEIICFFLSVTF